MDETELPDTAKVAHHLLRLLHHRSSAIRPTEIYGPLADILKLTSRQRLLKRQTTPENLWHNRVQTAREHLAKKGFMHRARRGFWSLTDEGHLEASRLEKMSTMTLDDLGL